MNKFTKLLLWDQNLSKRPFFWEWLLLTFVSAIFFWVKFKGAVIMAPDSYSYINFTSMRTMGYPSFLFLINKVGNEYVFVPPIQLFIYFVGVFLFSISISRLFKTYLGGIVLLFMFILNFEMVKNCFYILTESLSTSLILFILLFLVKFIKKQKNLYISLISLLIGLSIFVRPSSYSYLSLFPLIIFFYFPWFKRQVIKNILCLVGPISAIMLLSCTIQYFKNGFFGSESFLGHNLIGKVLLVARKDSPSSEPKMMKEIDVFSTPIRNMLEDVDNLQFKYILTSNYYDQLRYNEIHRLVKTIKNKTLPTDSLFRNVALDAIKAQPLLYTKDVLMNFYALWFLWDLRTFKENAEFKKILKKHSPLPYIKELPTRPRADTYLENSFGILIWLLRLVLGLAFLSSLIIPGAILYRRLQNKKISSTLLFSCFSGLLTHSYYLLVALSQVGIARYALMIWPALFASLVAFIIWCRDLYLKKQENK